MHIPNVGLHESESLEEAAALLTRYAPHARLLAGGTDLLVDLKCGRSDAAHLVSINRLETLRGVEADENGLRIGALTTISQLDRSPLLTTRFSPLRDATRQMAAPQIRNVATVGGNVVSAVPCADLPPILTAMQASLAIWSPAGVRKLPLESFFIGVRQTVLRENEVLTEVFVPNPPPRFGAAYARFALRAGNGIAVASVAASVRLSKPGTIDAARIVLGAVAPIPKRVESAEAPLIGQVPGADAFTRAAVAAMDEANPISDVRGSAEYRRELVRVLTRRALDSACRRAAEATP